MGNILAIATRELRNYFATPVGWLSLCGYILLTGFFFTIFLGFYSEQAATMGFDPYGPAEMNVDEYFRFREVIDRTFQAMSPFASYP